MPNLNDADYALQGAPALSYSKVWSATDKYYIVPIAAVWDEPGSVVRITKRGHNLVTGDVVNFECDALLFPGWAQSGVSVTVIDSSTFTIPALNDPGPFPNGVAPYKTTYSMGAINYVGTGNGAVKMFNLAAATEETWTLVATSATSFSVTGSVSGAQAACVVGVSYTNGIVSFLISAGQTAFQAGDTFTFSVVRSNQVTSTGKILGLPLKITCAKYSKLMFMPQIVQINTLAGGLTVELQSKIHPDAAWSVVGTYTVADGVVMYTFNPLVNFVRLVLTGGAGTVNAFAQYMTAY